MSHDDPSAPNYVLSKLGCDEYGECTSSCLCTEPGARCDCECAEDGDYCDHGERE